MEAVNAVEYADYMPRGGCLAFYTARDPEALAVGPAGTGKTLAACWKLHHVAQQVPNVRILMARKVLEDLKAGALATYINQVQPQYDGVTTFGGNRFYPGEFRYPNGSVIHVVGMDKPGKVMSAEYDIIYCFTGDTRIESPSPIEKGYKREYSGPLVTIRTARGNELTGTPNHPVLTDKGWIALGLLREGENVVSRSRVEDERTGGNPNIDHQPSTIAEIVCSLAFAESSRTERVEAVGMDFHGDGTNGQVDVVTTARGLGVGIHTEGSQHVAEHEFIGRNFEPHALVCVGTSGELFFGVDAGDVAHFGGEAVATEPFTVDFGADPPLASVVSSIAEVAGPFGVNISDMSITGGLGLAAGIESTAPQLRLDRRVADTDGGGDFVQPTFPFEVSADRIIHVLWTHNDERSVRHVYNLQTADHYYVANNIITHNCNEATELDEVTWQALKSRLRNNKLAYQQLIGDCNPAGPRHWLNVRCNKGLTRRITTTHKDNPAYWDHRLNQWTALGASYVGKTLESLTGVQRKRLLEGVWAAAEGIVYPEFVPEMIRTQDVDGWTTSLAVDVGSNNPTAILTIHEAGDERVHVSREVYRRNLTATQILDAIKDEADRSKPYRILIDPSAKGYIDDLRLAGYPAVQASNDVLIGIQRVKAQLQRGFSIDPSCVNTIDEFGLYAYPDNPKIETDKPTKEHDHAMDTLRYFCMRSAPIEVDIY